MSCIIKFNIKMNYQYKRLTFQAPKSYQELTNNRPTKKRNYNYTSQQDSGLQNINIPISSLKNQDKDFSFQNNESQSSKKRQKKSEVYSQQKQELSPIYSKDMVESEPQSPLNEKHIDQRLNNIDSISLKINSMLSNNKQRRPTMSTPLAEKGTNIEKYTIKQSSINESIPSISNQTRKDKSSKPKYSYISDEYSGRDKGSIAEKKYQAEKIVREDFRKKNLMSPPQIPQVLESENQKDQISQISSFKVNHSRRASYYAGQYIDRDKIKQEIQTELQVSLKKQKILSKNQQLDLKIDSLKHKMLDNSPLLNKHVQIQERKIEIEPFSQTLQVTKVANKISKHIEIDIVLLKIREAFESCKQTNKWQKLKSQLQARNIYLEQKQLKEVIAITIQQKNPFATKPQYPLNGFKDLAKLYAQSCRIWFEEIEKCVSLDSLAREDFSMSSIDLNHKGFINLQDLVCFVNVNSQKFYRSRDVLPLFKRFLKLQGKTIQKGSGQGITYGTFMQKIAQ